MPMPILRRLVILVACLISSSADTTAQSNEFRAFWVDAWNGGFWNSSQTTTLLNDTRAGNLNALVVQVRRRGDAFYNSNYEPKCTDMAAGYDSLADLITKGHDTSGGKQKVEIHAWLVTYHIWRGSTPPPQADHPLNLHPDWLLKDNAGNTFIADHYTFDPGHPAVQQHTFNVAMDIVTNYNVDGINFDYIRYSSANEGYNAVSVARFNQRFGRTGQPSPSDEVWKQFRRDQITQLLRKVYLSAIAVRPGVKVSADTITWAPGPTSDATWYSQSAAWNSILQDWRGWMEEGILDINIPMNYFRQTTHPSDYVNWSTFAKDRKFNRHVVIGPGIYLNSVANVITQMRQTREATALGRKAEGVCGYSYRVTNADGVSRSTFLNALVNPLAYDTVTPPIFATKVPVPDMPWKTAPTKGHVKGMLYGSSTTNGLDFGTVSISGPVNKDLRTDGTGFFGAVDMVPGNYSAVASFPGYFAKATNFTVTAGAVTTIDFLINPATFSITSQPLSQTVNGGGNVTFNVTANGTPPLTYQWRFAGTNITGATLSSYTRSNLQSADAGTYNVLVSNPSGSLLSSNAVLTVNVAPSIVTQPQGVTVNQGSNVTFTVTAAGSAPFSYQWRFGGVNIAGATLSSYTRNNIQTTDAGNYSVIVTNTIGSTASANATLTVNPQSVAPFIVLQPQNQSVTEGQTTTFSVSANGTLPFTYQWRFNGNNIGGASGSIYAIDMANAALAGNYSVIISNNAGFATSQNASLTVLPPFRAAGLEVLWKLAPGVRAYPTTSATERGVAFNQVSGNVLLVSRHSGTRIYVLDGDTGAEIRQMNTDSSIVTGGQFSLNTIGVADDGVVYGANLVLSPPGFKIYRWQNDAATTTPLLVYNGDPAPGTGNRWGDTIDVRGSGPNTQILVASRSGTNVSVLTTPNGTNFFTNAIAVGGVPAGAFGLGVAFGRGNTFWGKTIDGALRQVQFDLNNGAGTVIETYPLADVPGTICAIGVNLALNLLGGVSLETPDNLRIYQLSSGVAAPRFVGNANFGTDNANTFNTGSVDFGDDRVYAIDSNNGLVALRILPTISPTIEAISFPAGKVRLYLSDFADTNIVEATSDFLEWEPVTGATTNVGYIEFNAPANAPRYFRIKIP